MRQRFVSLQLMALCLTIVFWAGMLDARREQAEAHEAQLAVQSARSTALIIEARYRGWADHCIGVGVTVFGLAHQDAESVCYASVAEQAAKGKVVGSQWAVHWVWPPNRAAREASDGR